MEKTLQNYLNKLIGMKLEKINLACQMIQLDFGKCNIHCQTFARIKKENDILFTTYDYQSWDEKEDVNNDEWYFFNKYKKEIINGVVVKVLFSNTYDLTLILDNGITIEIFVSNGYHHYVEEQEQWRFLIDTKNVFHHFVIYNKHVETQ